MAAKIHCADRAAKEIAAHFGIDKDIDRCWLQARLKILHSQGMLDGVNGFGERLKEVKHVK